MCIIYSVLLMTSVPDTFNEIECNCISVWIIEYGIDKNLRNLLTNLNLYINLNVIFVYNGNSTSIYIISLCLKNGTATTDIELSVFELADQMNCSVNFEYHYGIYISKKSSITISR